MGRSIVGIILGFAVMFLIVSCLFMAGLFGLGLDWILEPGSYTATTKWSVITLGIGLFAGMSGGLLCAVIARRPIATKMLAALVLVIGGATAIGSLMISRPDPGPRPEGEAMEVTLGKLEEPEWVAVGNPIAGFAGTLIGGSLIRRKSKTVA